MLDHIEGFHNNKVSQVCNNTNRSRITSQIRIDYNQVLHRTPI